MFKLRFRLPSPALVVAMVTLSLVLGGTAVATTTATHKDARADSVLVKKLAPSLSVKHAKTADNATSAVNATNAVNATHATSADNAISAVNATNAVNATHATSADNATSAANATNAVNATHATSADNATNATNANNANNANNATTAQTANVAKAIGAVTYVKGTVRDAPANGGSGFAESTESDAFCPAGTAVIGTASHANDQGVEVSEVLVATATQVAGFFDNFNNIDEPNNFVIAICAAAASVNDPSGF
jgi:hypothetical protein